MCDKVRILMTGAGAPGGPGILKALEMSDYLDVHCADMNSLASGRFLSKNFHLIPSAEDPDFISIILNLCKDNDIKLIFPLVTMELFQLSKHKDLFKNEGIKVVVSDYESLSIANDKGALLKHLKKHNIRHPKFDIVEDEESLISSVMNLGYPNKTVVIKPSIGNGSRGIRILDPNKDKYQLLFNEKPNSLYSSLSEVKTAIAGRKIPEIVVSEYLPGDELTIDCIVFNNETKLVLIRSRDRMSGGISTAGRFIQEKEVESYIRSIIESFSGLHGAVGFQVKKSINDEYLLLESNPRIQGTSISALGCNINIPLLVVHFELNLPIPEISMKNNVGFVRYFSEAYYDSSAI